MKQISQSFFYALLSFIVSISLNSCYDDTAIYSMLQDHESRIYELEQLCNKFNTNISSLQTALTAIQDNDYITSVNPISENGKQVGYTISFAKSPSITIYHGADGKNGANGENGKNGENGENGKNGENGENGKDGHTPVVGISKDTDGIYYWTLNGEWLLDADL